MWNYLENIQEKPLHERRIATYVLTIVLFAIVIFFWVMFLNVEKARKTNTSKTESVLAPFQSIKDIFKGVFDGTQTATFPALNEIVPEDFFGENGQFNIGEIGTTTEMSSSTEIMASTTDSTATNETLGHQN